MVAFDRVRPQSLPAGVAFVQGDATDPGDCRRAIAGADTIFTTFAVVTFSQRLGFQKE